MFPFASEEGIKGDLGPANEELEIAAKARADWKREQCRQNVQNFTSVSAKKSIRTLTDLRLGLGVASRDSQRYRGFMLSEDIH